MSRFDESMNCDWIAPYYRWFEHLGFGGELQRRRCSLLPRIGMPGQVLVLGDGDGRFLARLLEQIQDAGSGAAIDAIEVSERMQTLARLRTGNRVVHRLGDARVLPLDRGRYDLIVTHFFLDCFDSAEAPALIARLAGAAAPRAQWLISEFRQAPAGWRATWCRAWLRSLYWFFRWTTGLEVRALTDHHPLLARHGFRLEHQETSRWGLLASELWVR
jgi:ubiquinone/menaquinone biosynthesis C-methylase UbiE